MPKKLRGSRGSRVGDNESCDLMVPLPKSAGGVVSDVESKLLVKEIQDRLTSTGFTHMALTHTIYGRPKPEDRADIAIPSSLWTTASIQPNSSSSNNNKNKKKKRKLNEPSSTHLEDERKTKTRILRRLHVVVENQSDMGFYLSNGPQEELLNEYDLVSVCPTNDVTFQSACASATMVDIITIDYTTRGLRLPYRIRSTDVKAAIERGATFEIPIAPALLHLKQRKSLVHACQELKNSSLGLKPRIIVSSGDRTLDGSDVGALALRIPGDLSNLCKTVLHFDDSTACNAVGLAAMQALQRGRERRFGRQGIAGSVSLIRKTDLVLSHRSLLEDEEQSTTTNGNTTAGRKENAVESQEFSEDIEEDEDENDNDIDDDFADGFIAM